MRVQPKGKSNGGGGGGGVQPEKGDIWNWFTYTAKIIT